MKRKELLLLVLITLLAFSPLVELPWSAWSAVSASGDAYWSWLYSVYQVLILAAAFMVYLQVSRALEEQKKRRALLWMIPVFCCLLSCVAGLFVSRDVRMQGIAAFAERSQTLITAIEKYEREQGQPPEALSELVPDYLPAIPRTGMKAYPQYLYFSGDAVRKRYAGNDWVLRVLTPTLVINLDQMFYFPQQNYADSRLAPSLERVGTWAYYHE